jgi:oligosaccharide translocation protein RFT1
MLVAGLLELLSEPYYNALQRSRAIKERASAEAAALFAKMVMLFVCVAWWKMDVLAYAFAQVAYSTMLLLAMVYVAPFPVISTVWNPASADKHPRHFLTSIRQHAAPLRGLFLQTGLKYVLQEGERILLVTLTTTEQQAIYALVSNLASVVPRTVLQPVEEMAYTMFCAFASVRDATPRSNLLSRGICLVWHIGLLFACFGPHYAAMFLAILYGSNASSMVQYAAPVLQAYLVYLLPMGLAGFSEAYTQAMATHHTKRMRQQNMQLVFFSAVFLGCAWLTVPTHGAMGLVCSNIVHVTIRFAVHLLTIRSDKIIRVPDLLPSYPSLLCWLGSSLLLGTLGASMSDWTRFGFGSLLGLLCLGAVWTTDRSRLEKLRRDPGETRAEKID